MRIRDLKFGKLSGIKLTYENGPRCPDSDSHSSFSLNMYCDPDMKITGFDFSAGVQGDLCTPYFDTVSKAACPNIVVSQLWGYLEEYKYYVGAFLLLTGITLTCVGRKLIKPAICCATFLTVMVISGFIFYAIYLEDRSDLSDFWYFVGFGALAGVILGLFMGWCVRAGAAILAAWGGASIALILYSSVIYRAEMDWLLWVTIVTLSLAFAISVFFFFDEVVIVATVVLGSYGLVRGIDCYAGHYVNELEMLKMAKAGMLD